MDILLAIKSPALASAVLASLSEDDVVVGTTGARHELSALLASKCPDIVVFEAGCAELGDWDGFARDTEFDLILVCEGGDHAVKAFQSNVFDYWPSPVSEARVRETLLRLRHKHGDAVVCPDENGLSGCLAFEPTDSDRADVRLEKVLFIYGGRQSSHVFLTDGDVQVAASLAKIQYAHPGVFLRVHNRYLVPTNRVETYDQANRTLYLRGVSDPIPVSWLRSQSPFFISAVTKGIPTEPLSD